MPAPRAGSLPRSAHWIFPKPLEGDTAVCVSPASWLGKLKQQKAKTSTGFKSRGARVKPKSV